LKTVIIGGGIAGVTAAETIRMLDKESEIALISEEEPLYSPCIFPHCLANEVSIDRIFLKKANDLEKDGIELIKQKATKIDKDQKKVYLSDGGMIGFDKLILSTGSRPAIPPIEGIERGGVFTFKSFDDFVKVHEVVQKKRGSAVIIGGGVIGVEVACALRKVGWDVYVVEFFNRVLPRLLDPEPASIVKEEMENNGIHVFTGERVEKITGPDNRAETVITNKRRIDCDMVISVTGMRPRTELAKEAGIELGRYGGIKVDSYMRTSASDIYACGDCVEVEDIPSGKSKLSMLWHISKLQGYVAGYNCLGIKKKFPGAVSLTIINLFDTYIASNANILDNFKEEKTKIIERRDGKNYLRAILLNNRVVSVQFVGKNIEEVRLGLVFGLLRKAKQLEALQETSAKEEIIQRVYPMLLSI